LANRAKRQHFVPRFYLKSFTNAQGKIWTHDCQQDVLRQTAPEETALEGNIYTPVNKDGDRIDFIDKELEKIEDVAAPILRDLLGFRKLDSKSKTDFAAFLATMFARSPAQLRQFAKAYAEMSDWAISHAVEVENRQRGHDGTISKQDKLVQEILSDKDNYQMSVDRQVGLMSFTQSASLMALMARMRWSFEISEGQQLITSDNSVNWVSGGPNPVDGPYGFGLAHPQAVIPFPLSPDVILRLDWLKEAEWTKSALEKRRARLANQYQAKHKDKYLYFRDRDDGFRKLGMKYAEPVTKLDVGVVSPNVTVVRKLKPREKDEES
jgi:Protein of unknown function (DUF4238)